MNPAKISTHTVAMRDYQESVTTGQTDAGQSNLCVPPCFAGDTISINMCICVIRIYRKHICRIVVLIFLRNCLAAIDLQ